MTLEDLEKMDLGQNLEKLIAGTSFDRMLDNHFEKMLKQGLTEEQIMQMIMGNQGVDFKDLPDGSEADFDPE